MVNRWYTAKWNGISIRCLADEITGCTDHEACNYNPDANEDDGSCLYYDCGGECGGSAIVDECGTCDDDPSNDCIDYCLDLHEGANLISFYALPDDVSITHVMSSIEGNATGVIGQGVAANYNGTDWVGSLNTISSLSGYWVIVSEAGSLCIEDGIPTDPTIQYSLESGANLISFPVEGSVEISYSLPDDIEGFVSGIIGEGVAATNQDGNWVGSLSALSGGNGYWMITTENISFSFDVCVTGGFDECGVCGGDGSSCSSTVCDIDGNCYETIQIGEQLWMAENLKVTHYRDGSEIQYVQSESSEPDVWENLSTGAYSYYEDDPSNLNTYGNLYNWYTVDDSRGLCMEGWHVPSDEEWTDLITYLDVDAGPDVYGTQSYIAGGKMKEEGLDHWYSPNTGATNESGFTAFPAGIRYGFYGNGSYVNMGHSGYFWSSSELYGSYAWHRRLISLNSSVGRYDYFKQTGFSIRCLRD